MKVYETNGPLWNPETREWLHSNQGFRVYRCEDVDAETHERADPSAGAEPK